MSTLREVLSKWMDDEITVVNPQSFAETAIKDVIRMETYKARVVEIGQDYIRLAYTAEKRKTELPVDQIIPLHEVKRVSVWGEEKLLHL